MAYHSHTRTNIAGVIGASFQFGAQVCSLKRGETNVTLQGIQDVNFFYQHIIEVNLRYFLLFSVLDNSIFVIVIMNLLPIQYKSNESFPTTSLSSNSLSTFRKQQTLPNTTNKLMNQLLSWRKSRRSKVIVKSATSYNNVCVIMKSEQSSCRIFSENQRQHNSLTECFHSHTTFAPVVSFINKDEGLISMQLMDRIMINDNELYSMGLSTHPISSYNNSNNMSSALLSNVSIHTALEPPTPPVRNDSLYDSNIEAQQWFHGSIHRDNAVKMLENSPIGSFIVRYSTTKQSCYALSVRVPSDYHLTGIAHYLIIITQRKTFKIKVFIKFDDLFNTNL